ncbi:MAG: ORF6N domain-containing protein [Patescibacteria group bacterium]
MKDLVVQDLIEQKIYLIRGCKVMLAIDLAILYGVPTYRLNEQVKRNIKRFPEDFMFRLTKEETISLRSQNAILTEKKFDVYRPYAFTEQGVAMLSSVLNSDRAIQVNIQIIRTFIKLRELLATHKDLIKKIEEMEKGYDRQFRIVFQIIRGLSDPPKESNKKIGFRP